MAERRPRRRVAVIFNPVTAGEEVAERKRELVEALTAAGADEVLVEETTPDDPGRGATRRALARGVDVVLAAGGDGTVMSCVSALAGSPTPLAVLPTGTGNLLANNLDLPGDLEAAAEVALWGRRRRLDVGELKGHGVDGDRFVVMSGMGFDAAMLRDADPATKHRAGAFAYVLSGLRQIGRRPAEYRITLDGLPPFSRVAQGVLVGNLGRLQGGLEVLPGAEPDDGMLDVGVLQTRSVGGWLRLAARVLLRRGRRGASGPPLELFRATRVDVVCNRPQPIERDGDTAPPRRHFAVEVLPGALTLCVPEAAEAEPQEGVAS
jgi:diacylglycerol kinase family enzyme